MDKEEYRVVIANLEQIKATVDEAGEEGWEGFGFAMTAEGTFVVITKRRKVRGVQG